MEKIIIAAQKIQKDVLSNPFIIRKNGDCSEFRD
jgi:hypothetical protein